MFRRAAGDDDPNAHASLGVMYAMGRGVRTDYGQAMRYSRRAAELGTSAGFFQVGWLLWFASFHGLIVRTVGQRLWNALNARVYSETDGRWQGLLGHLEPTD